MTRGTKGKSRLLLPGRDLSWNAFSKSLLDGFLRDGIDDVAGAVAFYCVLSLFPLLLFVVAVVSQIVSWQTIDDVVQEASRVAPDQVTAILRERLVALKEHPSGGLLTVGFLGALWSASAGVSSIIPALNRAYDVIETRPYWRRKLLAIAATLSFGVVALAASIFALTLPAIVGPGGGPIATLVDWIRLPVAGLVMMVIWALLYAFLPNVRPRFQPVTPGSVVGVLLWLGASWGFGIYARHFGDYEATYGALGGVIVLLLWMWVSAMALLLGAEINRILMPVEDKREVTTLDKEQSSTVSVGAQNESAEPSQVTSAIVDRTGLVRK